jgi:hypothetical protein
MDNRGQSCVLGKLGELKQRAGTEQCELLQQYVSITKAGPETRLGAIGTVEVIVCVP